MGSAIRAFVYSSCCRRSPGFPSTLFRVHCHRKRRHQCCWLGVIHRLLLTEPFPVNLAKLLLEAFWRRVSWLSPLSSLISVPTCRVFVAQAPPPRKSILRAAISLTTIKDADLDFALRCCGAAPPTRGRGARQAGRRRSGASRGSGGSLRIFARLLKSSSAMASMRRGCPARPGRANSLWRLGSAICENGM